ncbi:hypothetical protein [Dictyobacter formicarum]|uniref:Transposase TnpC homeodomain domain-containing protein n=1 Tax=Dictyobacter formicarum TaxID=2778368 RepID=A0ABQ3V918_9CHLR|nr:hypothetical protein [Dictyobacter formicarum]GHO82001.1 hypothetical protein KSZ_00070 [Dictyobacter formicarum]
MAKLGERRMPQEVIQLKKTILALQRQVTCLEDLLARCTYGVHQAMPSPFMVSDTLS